MLESRETKDVSTWLKQFPCLEVIARDGSRSYANAIKDAHPKTLQVSDQFHLISRLTEIGKKILYRDLPSRVVIPLNENEEETLERFFLYASRREKILYVRNFHK